MRSARAPFTTRKNELGGFRFTSTDAEQAIGNDVSFFPRGATANDTFREPAQILDEYDSECDRECPKLADRQRLDALIGANVAIEGLEVEAAVAFRRR